LELNVAGSTVDDLNDLSARSDVLSAIRANKPRTAKYLAMLLSQAASVSVILMLDRK
jgi:hypothetical protein